MARRKYEVKKRICKRCGKEESPKFNFTSPYCRGCQEYLGNIKRREILKEKNICIDCGKKKAKANKCPHCKEIVSYCIRCEECLSKSRIKPGDVESAK